MSQIEKKFIENNAVGAAQILLENNVSLRGRDASNTTDINILKINTSDLPEFTTKPQSSFAPTANNDLTNKNYVDTVAGGKTWRKQAITLTGTDITNQYVDLSHLAVANSMQLVVGGVMQEETLDYTLAPSGGVTRLSFAGGLATGGISELVSGDILYVQFQS